MAAMKHLRTALITFVIWFTFWLLGLPSDYYQTWSRGALLALCAFAFIFLIPLTYWVLREIWKDHYLRSSLWLAFYGSVPLALYDYVYLGLIEGLGHAYHLTHWYLSIFYGIVWVAVPLVAWFMEKRAGGATRRAAS